MHITKYLQAIHVFEIWEVVDKSHLQVFDTGDCCTDVTCFTLTVNLDFDEITYYITSVVLMALLGFTVGGVANVT